MNERKYLEDVPKEIQNSFLDEKVSSEDILRIMRENYDVSDDEIFSKCAEIRKRVWALNPELAPRFEQKTGCLLLVAAVVVFSVVVSLPDEMWKSDPTLPIILTVVFLGLVFGLWRAVGVTKGDVKKVLNPSPPEPKKIPEIMPKDSRLMGCKTCGKEVSQTAPTCPHCGESLPGVRVICPKCNSTNIQIGEKGYGALKGVVGGVILGPGGLLVGFHGRKDIQLKCLSCGNMWKPKG